MILRGRKQRFGGPELMRNEGTCGFAPEGAHGGEISLCVWSQHPGEGRETRRRGWNGMAGCKTKKTFHKLLSKSGLSLLETGPRKGGPPARDSGQPQTWDERCLNGKPRPSALPPKNVSVGRLWNKPYFSFLRKLIWQKEH